MQRHTKSKPHTAGALGWPGIRPEGVWSSPLQFADGRCQGQPSCEAHTSTQSALLPL